MIYRTAPYSATLNDPYLWFQGHTIIWCWISQKRYQIQTYNIQLNTNRDLHTPYSTVSFRMTLSDLAKYSMTRSTARSLQQLSFLLVVFEYIVCPSHSDVPVLIKTAQHIVIIFSSYPSHSIHLREIPMGSPLPPDLGALNTWGIKISRFLNELYLTSDT